RREKDQMVSGSQIAAFWDLLGRDVFVRNPELIQGQPPPALSLSCLPRMQDRDSGGARQVALYRWGGRNPGCQQPKGLSRPANLGGGCLLNDERTAIVFVATGLKWLLSHADVGVL